VAVVRGTPHLVPGLVFGAALACVTYAAANAPIWGGPHASASQVHALLREEGYGALAVKPGEGDKLVIAGVLNREADKDRLRQIVDAREVPARIEVQTSESLAQNVEDVFMANGLAATARPNGLARVQVQVTGPAEEVAKVEKVALADVRGLRGLDISRVDGGGDRFGKVFDEGPGKRVVSVVGGDAGYVATADGARYFAGSMLPTGDRIVAVESQAVTVEKGGAQTKLMF
jgi:type III secretion protein D